MRSTRLQDLQYFYHCDINLLWNQNGTLVDVRRLSVKSASCELSRRRWNTAISKGLGMDMFQYHSQGKEGYVKQLAALEPWYVAACADQVDVDDRAKYFTRLQLAVDFRFLESLDRVVSQMLLAMGKR